MNQAVSSPVPSWSKCSGLVLATWTFPRTTFLGPNTFSSVKNTRLAKMLTPYETNISVQTIPPPAKTPNTFLLCLFLLLFPVFPAIPDHCDHWSDIRGHYSLPGSPQGCPSATVEVSIWVLHPRHSRAGRPHCFHQQRRGGGHMEFNAVHSYVTNRIRILHQVAESQQSSLESLGCFFLLQGK